jgi:hypothetical protein
VKEREITEDQVRREHLAEVHQPTQWLYLLGVLVGGSMLMVALIAVLDALG